MSMPDNATAPLPITPTPKQPRRKRAIIIGAALGAGLLLCVCLAGLLIFGNSSKGTTATGTSVPLTQAAQGATVAPTAAALPGLNQLVSIKNWDVIVTAVERPGKQLNWSAYGNKSTAAGMWLVVAVGLKNTGAQNYGVNTTDFTLYGAGGVKYAVSTDPGAFAYSEHKGGQRIGGQAPPGVSVRYYVVFDVAPDASGLTFRFNQDKQPTFALGDAGQ